MVVIKYRKDIVAYRLNQNLVLDRFLNITFEQVVGYMLMKRLQLVRLQYIKLINKKKKKLHTTIYFKRPFRNGY